VTVLAEARASLASGSTTVLAEAVALNRGAPLAECIGVFASGFLQILGRAAVQRIGLRVYLAGERIDQHLLGTGWEVAREITQPNATARFDTTAAGNPLGNPLAMMAPPPGLGSIDLRLVFRLDDGTEREVPLMTNAMVDSGDRSSEGRTAIDALALRDAGARYRTLPVEYLMPAGGGLFAEAVIRALATRAGSPSEVSGHPWRVRKEVRVGQGDEWFDPAQSIAEVEGGFLGWNRHGRLVSFFDRPEVDTAAPKWVWTPDDIVARVGGQLYGVRIEPPADPAHKVTVEGTEQVLRAEPGEECGNEVVTLTGEATDDNFVPVPLGFHQNGAGAVSPYSSPTPSPVPGLVVAREVKVIERECGTEISETTRRFAFYLPGQTRYHTDGEQTVLGWHACFLEADEPDALGFVRVASWFQEVFRETRVRTFVDGYLRRTVTERFGFRFVQAAIRARGSRSDPWETAAGDSSQFILGDGTRVIEPGQPGAPPPIRERIQPTERIVEEDDVADGRVLHRRTVTEGWNRRPGFTQLYADGFESGDSEETFREVDRFDEWWRSSSEQRHTYSLIRADGTGETEEREGAGPAAERHQGVPVDPELFDDPEDAEQAAEASRWEQKPLKVIRTMPQVLTVRPGRAIAYRSQRAETLAQLDRIALRLLLANFACRVRFHIAPNPYVERGDLGHAVFPPDGLDHDLVVEGARWSQAGPGTPILLEVTGRTRP
jgi:hypothetical protein